MAPSMHSGLKHTAVAVIVMTMEGEEDLEEVRDV